MTEKLLTGMLSLNTNNTKKKIWINEEDGFILSWSLEQNKGTDQLQYPREQDKLQGDFYGPQRENMYLFQPYNHLM